MIYPTIKDLNKGNDYNRYEIALATAKCARMITNEYVRQREEAEHAVSDSKDGDKPLNNYIDREVRDEKAVKIAIARINRGDYTIVHKDPALQEAEEAAFLESITRSHRQEFNPRAIMMGELEDEADDESAEDIVDDATKDVIDDITDSVITDSVIDDSVIDDALPED